jgi:hypothetical protein
MVDERNSALQSQRWNAWFLGALACWLCHWRWLASTASPQALWWNELASLVFGWPLGSSLPRVMRDAVAPGVVLSAGGAVIGGILAAACTTVLKGLLYGVQTLDATTFLIVPLALVAVGTLASLLPAFSLTRLAPANVPRQD